MSARAQDGQTHAAMNRVAWLTCALLSVAGARIYDRCELALELSALGVRPDHISTWVCIAFHESRFDTSANNPYSGDHGIFQISELYWCGPGKACGLPCSALRDDDISDDLDCALTVHEEHTRLQGNGFLAWVVYPQHCKQNTKKYLVDCDINAKKSVPITRSRGYQYANSYDQPNDTTDRQIVENLLPPYLSIGSFIRENYGKVFEQNGLYKIDNIDDLKLPVFNQPSQHISMPPTTSAPRRTTPTTTTAPRRTTTATTITTEYIPPVKVWRVIETNQFRKKQKFSETTTKKEYATEFDRYTQNTRASTAIQLPSTTIRPISIATTLRPVTKTAVTTATYRSPTSTFTFRLPSTTTNYRPPTSLTTNYRPTTVSTTNYRSPTSLTTNYRPPTSSTTNYSPTTSSTTNYRPSTSSTTNYRPPTSSTTYRPFTWATTYKPITWTTTRKPISTALSTRQWFSTTTQKPSTTSVTPKIVTTTYRPATTTTRKTSTTPTTRRPTTAWRWSSTISKIPTVTSNAVTSKPKKDFSWYTFTSRTATRPMTTKLQPFGQTRTTQPIAFTEKVQNNLHNSVQTKTTQAVAYSNTYRPQTTTQKPKTTQSIFDLYLNPTKAPQLPSYKYSWGQSKLKIFAGGTTTTPSPVQSTRGRGGNNNGAARNYVKRQI